MKGEIGGLKHRHRHKQPGGRDICNDSDSHGSIYPLGGS